MKLMAAFWLCSSLFAASKPNFPIVFVKNQGQVNGPALFVYHGPGFRLELEQAGWSLVTPSSDSSRALHIKLLGARSETKVEGVIPLGSRTSYLLGNDPSQWHTGISTFEQVRYLGIYPGIDLLFHGSSGKCEFDFVLLPGSNAKAIRLLLDGAKSVQVTRDGGLRLRTGTGILSQSFPKIYQDIAGKRVEVAGRYRVKGNVASFELASYNRQRPLTIDPTLTFATYLGGSSTENQGSMALDQAGNAYVTGNTFSTDFPVSKTPLQALNAGAPDVFVSKSIAVEHWYIPLTSVARGETSASESPSILRETPMSLVLLHLRIFQP